MHIPWSQREIDRFVFREALFRRRGDSPIEAEQRAERLVQRDRDRDERRYCLECQHIRPMTRCAANGSAVKDLLQRCELFDWEAPQ